MTRLAILPVVIMLTTPDGQPVWIETMHVQTIRSDRGSCHQHANSILRFESGTTLCVMETPDEISD